MKAKEYAARLLAAEDAVSAVAAEVQEIIYEAVAKAKTLHKPISQVAVFRESFQKWRSVCATVRAAKPKFFIEEGIYLKVLHLISPGLYAVCGSNGAFVGYDMDDEDKQALESATKKAVADHERKHPKVDTLAAYRAFLGI